MKYYLPLTLTVCALNLACAMAFAQQAEVPVPFSLLPNAVQNKLVDEVPDTRNVRSATVTMGLTADGKTTYTGRLLGADGMIQTVTVDEQGRLLESRKGPGGPFALP